MQLLLYLLALPLQVTLAEELWLPAFDRRPKFLELYSLKSDDFLRTKLVQGDYVIVVETESVPSSSFTSFELKSQLDYLDSFNLAGAAELNVAVGFLQGKVAASADVRSELNGKKKSVVYVIKYSKRTRIDRVDPCAENIESYVFDDLLDLDDGPGTHVVVAATYGVEFEVHVKVDLESNGSQDTVDSEVSAQISSMFKSFEMSGKFGSSSEKRSSREEISISVRTRHVLPPFAQPKNLEDVPGYIDNATSFIATSNTTGGILGFVVEEIRCLRQCIKGKLPGEKMTPSKSNLVVARLRAVSTEIDRQDSENNQLLKRFEMSRYCFTTDEAHNVLKAKSAVDEGIEILRRRLECVATDYRAEVVNLTQALADMDSVMINSSSFTMPSRISRVLSQKLSFVSIMSSYNVMCFRPNWNPLFLSYDTNKKETRYFPYELAGLNKLMRSKNPGSFASDCLNASVKCFLLNCDTNPYFCSNIDSRGYYTEKNSGILGK